MDWRLMKDFLARTRIVWGVLVLLGILVPGLGSRFFDGMTLFFVLFVFLSCEWARSHSVYGDSVYRAYHVLPVSRMTLARLYFRQVVLIPGTVAGVGLTAGVLLLSFRSPPVDRMAAALAAFGMALCAAGLHSLWCASRRRFQRVVFVFGPLFILLIAIDHVWEMNLMAGALAVVAAVVFCGLAYVLLLRAAGQALRAPSAIESGERRSGESAKPRMWSRVRDRLTALRTHQPVSPWYDAIVLGVLWGGMPAFVIVVAWLSSASQGRTPDPRFLKIVPALLLGTVTWHALYVAMPVGLILINWRSALRVCTTLPMSRGRLACACIGLPLAVTLSSTGMVYAALAAVGLLSGVPPWLLAVHCLSIGGYSVALTAVSLCFGRSVYRPIVLLLSASAFATAMYFLSKPAVMEIGFALGLILFAVGAVWIAAICYYGDNRIRARWREV